MMFKNTLFSLSILACMHAGMASLEHPADVDKRQCRSVHLIYDKIPQGNKALYMETKALQSAPGTYFSSLGFNEGYFGFQELHDGRKVVIFSVWDPGVDAFDSKTRPDQIEPAKQSQLLGKGEGVETGRFGGEGTGGKSMLAYDWQVGESIKFLVTAYYKDNDTRQVISGWFFDNKNKQWKLMSSWETKADKRRLDTVYSFVEDFRRNYESAKNVRKAEFGPLFVYTKDNSWHQITAAAFSADSNPSLSINAGTLADGCKFFLQTGGDTNMQCKLGATIKLGEPSAKTPYPDATITKMASEGSSAPAADKAQP